MEYLKVSSKSSPASVAGAIAGMVKDGVPVNMQCVGAGAVNQAIKAMAIARGFLIPTGFDISCAPTFSDILINGESRTAIRLAVIVHRISLQGAEADQVSDAAMVYVHGYDECTAGAFRQDVFHPHVRLPDEPARLRARRRSA